MDDMLEIAQEMMPEGWDVESESTLICPHGETIEWDGRCPEGCVSPLISMGMI